MNFGNLTTSYGDSVDYKETRSSVQAKVMCSKGINYDLKGQHAPLLSYAAQNNLTYRAWFLPLYNVENPREDEFVAYRLNFIDINGNMAAFGDGVQNAYPSAARYITSKGTGSEQIYDFIVRIWTYRMLTPGIYEGNYTINVNY